MIKSLIVDSHILMREGVKAVLSSAADILVSEIGEAASAIRKINEQHWDVVILDISLADKNGIELLKQIRREKPALPVLIFSNYPEHEYGMRAIRLGAAGYLAKTCHPNDLIIAIRKIAAGGKYISSWLTERLIEEIGSPVEKEPHDVLSDREFEIFRLIASGHSLKEAARLLHLSVSTVSTYRGRILQKMRMQNDAQIITYAIKTKLIG